MSFIFLWKPSVMALFLVKLHMSARGCFQESRVSARVIKGAKVLWRRSPRTSTRSRRDVVLSFNGEKHIGPHEDRTRAFATVNADRVEKKIDHRRYRPPIP